MKCTASGNINESHTMQVIPQDRWSLKKVLLYHNGMTHLSVKPEISKHIKPHRWYKGKHV